MSFNIEDNSITLTRGDTMRVQVDITIDGQEYTPVEGDTVRFALKHDKLKADKTDYIDTEPLILKTIPIDTMVLEIEPEDTKSLGFGKYVYDVQITFADGTVQTFITKAPFKLTEEVE